MSAAEPPVREVERPTVLVMAVPYVLATALASNLRGPYNVVAPNLDAGEPAPSLRWDAIVTITGVPVPTDIMGVVIELPNTTFHEPVMVTVDERTTPVHVSAEYPMLDVVALLEHHLSSSV